MPRIRSIKPEFFQDEDLAALPPLDRLVFIGIWTQADKAGRLEDRPARLKVQILPYDSADMGKILGRLIEKGFIVRYTAEGRSYLWVRTFLKHQRPHHTEQDSLLPAPTPCNNGAITVGQQAGMEEGMEEEEGMEKETNPSADADDVGVLAAYWNEQAAIRRIPGVATPVKGDRARKIKSFLASAGSLTTAKAALAAAATRYGAMEVGKRYGLWNAIRPANRDQYLDAPVSAAALPEMTPEQVQADAEVRRQRTAALFNGKHA